MVDLVEELGFKNYILIGDEFQKVKNNAKSFIDVTEAKAYFDKLKVVDKKILIKGSRGLKLEKLITNS